MPTVNLGLLLVLAAALPLIVAGGVGLLSLALPHRRPAATAVAPATSDSRQSATPPNSRVAYAIEPADLADDLPRKVVVDEGLIEELFAEMFSIRATVGQLRRELKLASAGAGSATVRPAEAANGEEERLPAAA